MADVFINTKWHRNIERLSVEKLEHLCQLAQVEIDNYKRYARSGKDLAYEQHMKSLTARKTLIENVLARSKLKSGE